MSKKKKKIREIGEHSSVAEELLMGIPEIEFQCRAVEESVSGGYYTFQEALTNYKVTEDEYNDYIKQRNERRKE